MTFKGEDPGEVVPVSKYLAILTSGGAALKNHAF
jgi:hypothetical protein